jgi:hypothetical protein
LALSALSQQQALAASNIVVPVLDYWCLVAAEIVS